MSVYYPRLLNNLVARTAIAKMSTKPAGEGSKWFDALPKPKSEPKRLSVEELHDLRAGSEGKVLVVDVRRADIEVSIAPSMQAYLRS